MRYTLSQLLTDYSDDWDIRYAPIGGDQYVIRAVLLANPDVIIACDTAVEVRDAIEARKATA
jgi:hypothetical protein